MMPSSQNLRLLSPSAATMLRKTSLVLIVLLFPFAAFAGSQTFTATGAAQTFTVPAGISSITVELHGAGGASHTGESGGTGGKTIGTLAVTPGQQLTIIVGKTGSQNQGGFGGGGNAGPNGFGSRAYHHSFGGGGRSAIRLADTTEIMTAGGGGGASWRSVNTDTMNVGGGGGGQTGGNGEPIQNGATPGGVGWFGGGGGTQTAGGVGFTESGIKYRGAYLSASSYSVSGGGGGGGWYGGGGGEWDINSQGGSGGGGSGYCGGAGVSNCTTTRGAGSASDTDGKVIISWSDAALPPPPPPPPPPVCNATTNPITKTTGASGSQTFSNPGSHSFVVPKYDGTLKVEVWGGGGGGGTIVGGFASAGGTSSWNDDVLGGGGGGGKDFAGDTGGLPGKGAGGIGGTASGGDINRPGNPGENGGPNGGDGGSAPFGGAGGESRPPSGGGGQSGFPPGGGGASPRNGFTTFIAHGGGGGSGGYAKKSYDAGVFAPGESIPVIVGSGGQGAPKYDTIYGFSYTSGTGAPGAVKVSWTSTGQTSSICAAGFILKDGTCVSTAKCTVCPAGQTLDASGQCVPDTTCSAGFHFDLATNQCVIDAAKVCASGFHLDTATNQCVSDAGGNGITLTAPSTAVWKTTPTIIWSAKGVTSCTGTNFDTGGATSGTVTTDPITKTTTYTLTCTDDTGGTKTKSVTIKAVCPAGYTGTPPVCTLDSNSCPIGYEGTPPNCTVASSCPLGYEGTPPACTPVPCTPTNICSGNNVVNSCTGAVIKTCVAPATCSGSACVVPAPKVVEWKVTPLLVHKGGTANVSWSVLNVATCSVKSTNNDLWKALTGEQTSRPIFAQTVFTLHCLPLSGSSAPDVSRSTTVNIVPGFQEK